MEDLLQRITVNPNMAFGKPTIRGLRYSVEWLLELLSSGMSQQEILEDYEDLEAEDIYAVLAYAAKLEKKGVNPRRFSYAQRAPGYKPFTRHPEGTRPL